MTFGIPEACNVILSVPTAWRDGIRDRLRHKCSDQSDSIDISCVESYSRLTVGRDQAARCAGRALAAAADRAWSKRDIKNRPVVKTCCSCIGISCVAKEATGGKNGVEGWIAMRRNDDCTIAHIAHYSDGSFDISMFMCDVIYALCCKWIQSDHCLVRFGGMVVVGGVPLQCRDASIRGCGDLVQGIVTEHFSYRTSLNLMLSHPVSSEPFCVIDENGRFHSFRAMKQTRGMKTVTLFTGSFNPLHTGHESLLRAVKNLQGADASLPFVELALVNADKPTLDPSIALARAAQFAGKWPVVLSRLPLFVEKARAYAHIAQNIVFVIGFDTMRRVLDSKYYGGSIEQTCGVLEELRTLGASFLVAGRKSGGVYRCIATERASLPAYFEIFDKMFIDIPETVFRVDMSSTEIRERLKQQQQARQ